MLLQFLQRLERGLKLINDHLKRETTGAGRRPMQPFVIFLPPSEEDRMRIGEQLTKLRGKAAAKWEKGARRVDEKQLFKLLTSR